MNPFVRRTGPASPPLQEGGLRWAVSGLGAPQGWPGLGNDAAVGAMPVGAAEWYLLPSGLFRSQVMQHLCHPTPSSPLPPAQRHSPLRRSTGLERQLVLCQLFLVT